MFRAPARLAQVLDVVLVLVFVLIGRVSHKEDLGIVGVLTTLWPFLVGLVVGHIVTFAWRRPFAVVRTGLGVWAATVVVGMLLRLASGQGVEPGFVIVTTIVLAVFLLGWRAVASAVARRRRVRG